MKSNPTAPDRKPPPPNAGPGLPARILRLVKSAPERQAIESGQVDAVVEPVTGNVFMLPHAQQALREDEARIRSLLALSSDWCWEQDENYRFVLHSGTAAENSTPYDDGIIGKVLWDLPFDNMQEADWNAHRRQLEWRATFRDLELKCTDRAGKIRWVSISGEPTFDEQDRFNGYRGTTRDITLRKQSEASARVLRERESVTERTRAERILGNGAERKRQERLLGLGRKVAKRGSIANSVLAALPHKDHQSVLAGLEPVTLNYGEVLYEPGERIRHVYFPNDCIVSLLTTVEGHQALEVGLVGREGMVGISLALGIDVSSVRALVQGTGTAMRMSAARFRKELRSNQPFRSELLRFAHAKLAQARQNAACNRFHMVEARLARWLLMTRDRARSDEFLLTHEFLADMLGVRRVGVSLAAGALQKRKLISYSRGKIRILDRKGLEAASCGCYEVVRNL
jgi:PAS domain S-box-containing protein